MVQTSVTGCSKEPLHIISFYISIYLSFINQSINPPHINLYLYWYPRNRYRWGCKIDHKHMLIGKTFDSKKINLFLNNTISSCINIVWFSFLQSIKNIYIFNNNIYIVVYFWEFPCETENWSFLKKKASLKSSFPANSDLIILSPSIPKIHGHIWESWIDFLVGTWPEYMSSSKKKIDLL